MATATTPIYNPSPPTISPQTEDGRNLADWVQRELKNLSQALADITRVQVAPLSAPPATPREGLLTYADGVSWNPFNAGKGLVVYDGATNQFRPLQTGLVKTAGDANYSILLEDRLIVISPAFTAARTWTLPPASSFGSRELLIVGASVLSNTNTLTIQRQGSDNIVTLPSGTTGTSVVISAPSPYIRLSCDGTTWYLTSLVVVSSFTPPTAVRAGDIMVWNGSIWTTLAGNNANPAILKEDSAGNPSWIVSGGGTTNFLRDDLTFAAPPQSWTLLNTVTVSGGANIDDHVSFTDSFADYELVLTGLATSAAVAVQGRFYIDGTLKSGVADYEAGATTAAQITVVSAPSAAITRGNGDFHFYDARTSATQPFISRGLFFASGATVPVSAFSTGGVYIGTAGKVSGVQIFPASGTISGKLKIYGRN